MIFLSKGIWFCGDRLRYGGINNQLGVGQLQVDFEPVRTLISFVWGPLESWEG